MKRTQKQDVLEYMQEHGSITSWDAITMFGATRLSGIIYNLKKDGHIISTKSVAVETRYGRTVVAQYTLEDEDVKVS